MKAHARTPLISIIVPVYNEADNLPLLYKEIAENSDRLPYQFEMLFVDDGSQDDSAKVLHKFARKDRRIRLIRFSRNFGKEAAVTAGLHAARGNAALIMDADMQMPPSLMTQFIRKWETGSEVVVGVFKSRNLSFVKRMGAKLFYKIMRRISHTKITPNATDYRLLDRKVINVFNQFTERNRITRGLIDWLGFDRDYIYFEQQPRKFGTPGYTFQKLVGLAMNSFTAYSLLPLRLAGYIGAGILAVSVPAGVFLYVERYILGDYLHLGINGTTMLAMLTIFMVGLVLTCLGMMSLYIAHIHAEVSNRPLYVVRPEEQHIVQEAELFEEVKA
ncbi:MAG TPA: glycosyltransferase family 2 protein [Candidatus Saccharimonadales bacterium]|nr:glycosyltransferase family 2 protein [Candidatus Saccharimonadales bacterium]